MKINLQFDKRILLSIGLLALLPLVFLWRVAFWGDILLSLDMLLTYEPWRGEIPGSLAFPLWNELMADPVRTFYPIALYIRESWQSGELPFWYPYGGLGLPILAANTFQVLYPVNSILWQIIPLAQAFGWSTVLHLFMGSFFTFLFLQELGVRYFGRLVAAISFTYSSSLIMWLGLPSSLDSMVWLPFIFWGIERAIGRRDWRWSLLGALGVMMQILAGQIQLVLYAFTALILYSLCRAIIFWRQEKRINLFTLSPLIYTGLALMVGGSLAAFQLLPLAELVPTIRRGEGNVDLYNTPLSLFRLLIPDLFGTNIDGHTMFGYRFEIYLYLGILPLFFAIASLFSRQAWLARCLVGLGLFFLLPVFNIPPVYQLFYYLYPTFPTLGFARAMYIIVFFWAAAAGIGAQSILSNRPKYVLKYMGIIGLIIGGLALIYLGGLAFLGKYQARYFWNLPNLPEFQPSIVYHFAVVFQFLVLLGATILLLWAWASRFISPRIFVILSIGLIIFDLFLTHIDFAPVLPNHLLYPATPSLSFLEKTVKEEIRPFRISGVDRVLWPNTSGVFSLPVVQVYDSFLSNRYFEYADASGVRAPSNLRVITFKAEASSLVDALNAKYLYTPRDSLAAGDGISLLHEIEPPQVVSDHTEAGQIFEWSINNWSQEVLLAPSPSTVHYQGMLPGNFRLETAIAIDPQFWEADGVLFEIYATQPGQESGAPIFAQTLHPRNNIEDRAWIPVQVDLSEFARQPLILSLVTRPEGASGVRGGWAHPLLVDADQWELLYYGPNSIYKNKLVLPRSWVVHKAFDVSPGDISVAKEILMSPEFDPANAAVIEGTVSGGLLPPASVEITGIESVEITHYHPSRIEISAKLAAPGVIVLSDLYYPGWNVYVDGLLQPLLPVNIAMRGVFVDEGSHEIVFLYEPQSFRWGVIISISVLMTVLVALLVTWLISRSRSGQKGDI